MKIQFKPLTESNFSLLLEWLEKPHVEKWWDQGTDWAVEKVTQKYKDYVKGYKTVTLKGVTIQIPIHAFIIQLDEIFIGIILYYSAHNSSKESDFLEGMPQSLAAIDMFIGEEKFTGQGIGSKALSLFLDQYVFKTFDFVLVDPNAKNLFAINSYKSAGFMVVHEENSMVYMLKYKHEIRLPFNVLESIKEVFNKIFLKSDHLWLFGSRTNKDKRGGDIDLYIETDIADYDDLFEKKIAFLSGLKKKIGDQKIDVIIKMVSSDYDLPVYTLAKSEGVKII